MIQPPLTNQRSWFLVAATLSFALVVGFSGYFEVKQSSLEKQITQLNAQKASITAPASDSTGTSTNSLVSVLAVQQKLKTLETNQLPWSKIIEKIETTIPKLKDSSGPIVEFRSYSGTAEGKLSVSATTLSGASDPFTDVALTIRSFATDPLFRHVFVPSITKSLTPEGAVVLSFSMNLEYQKPTF